MEETPQSLVDRFPLADREMCSGEPSLEELTQHQQAVDDLIWERRASLRDTLKDYRIDITELGSDTFRIACRDRSAQPLQEYLPIGYAYKGGNIARKKLGCLKSKAKLIHAFL